MLTDETRNKSGQVRAKPVRDALLALLSRDIEDINKDQPKTVAQRIAYDLVLDTLSPSLDRHAARKELLDRAEGKPAQAIIGDKNEDAIQHELAPSDKAILERYIQQRTGK